MAQTAFKEKKVAGTVDAEFRDVRGSLRDPGTFEGGVSLSMRDLYLWDMPLFYNMLSLKLFSFRTHPVFTIGLLRAKISGGKLVVEEIAFQGEDVDMRGNGEIGFDGGLNLLLNTRTKTVISGIPGINILEGAIDLVKDNIYAVEITGTFAAPVHSAKLLPTILPEKK
ncbi:MAG: hypothetical protein A2Z34_05115 [Planctomycetes bacterium RBG_16_59_8]|nr:MAG: hypothetical protein A2Z34_05115 [Planctomycetes bacterium RBG_16_59_8]